MNKNDLKIVFLGTPDFAVESLKRIHESGYNVVGVITMPDKPAGRGHKMLSSPVKKYAEANGLNLMQPPKLKDPEFVEQLRSLEADLFIVIAFRMLPEVVWTMPRLGTFNLHASLLPKYRGAAPINWAVINGDSETGVTTFFLKHEIDTGDIIDRQSVEIKPDENVGDVHDKLMMLGADLTIKTIESILDGTLHTTPQKELTGDAEPTPAPKIFKDTCRIDWNQPSVKIHNLVRGLSPYPAAWSTMFDDDKEIGDVKIFETEVIENFAPATPGTIHVTASDSIIVNCGEGAIRIKSLQIPGKRRMDTAEYLKGARLSSPRFA